MEDVAEVTCELALTSEGRSRDSRLAELSVYADQIDPPGASVARDREDATEDVEANQ